jgi:hypothetical protein
VARSGVAARSRQAEHTFTMSSGLADPESVTTKTMSSESKDVEESLPTSRVIVC